MMLPRHATIAPLVSLLGLLGLAGCGKDALPPPPGSADTASGVDSSEADSAETDSTETDSAETDSTSADTDTPSTDDTATEPTQERPPECEGLPTVTWEGWSDGFFKTWCRACHSATTADRNGAPEGLDFDTEAQVAENASLVRYSVLEAERMPMGGGLYEEDLYLLEVYLDCDLP